MTLLPRFRYTGKGPGDAGVLVVSPSKRGGKSCNIEARIKTIERKFGVPITRMKEPESDFHGPVRRVVRGLEADFFEQVFRNFNKDGSLKCP